MKKTLFLVAIMCLCLKGYGQIIRINNSSDAESSYDPQKLIEDVLISSECTTVNNFSFQVKGSPTDTSIKSYGFFKKPLGSNFPFEEGVILTTGIAFQAGNLVDANIIDNINGLSGDVDLQTALSQVNTNDATFIKFNFVPLVDNISFRFIMASEEYDGVTECDFADSFAFLLREVGTAKYNNLAVLPDGTPVSVKNINRSSLINNAAGQANCDSNTAFFDGYNLGSTNYGGRTKVLTASANVVPNKVYEIKLVVADVGDSLFDSAIFLEAGSFNIGGDLGKDRTIAAGNPGCDGTPVLLDATSQDGSVYKWFKDGVEIVGETNKNYAATINGTYKVEINLPGGCSSSDEIVLEFITPPFINNTPKDLFICETDNNGIETFNLTNNSSLVLGSQITTDFTITYHLNEADANSNRNAIVTPETYVNTNTEEMIWLRIATKNQVCFKVTSFRINVLKQAVANKPRPYEVCDNTTIGTDTDGLVSGFDLSTKINEALGAQSVSDYDVRFYYSQADADAKNTTAEITTTIPNTINPQPIYARVENKSNTACYDTTSFNLIVHPLPVLKGLEVDLKQCDTDIDRISLFNLTEANELISTNHTNENFTYYLTEAQAKTGLIADRITNFTDYANTIPGSGSFVYTRVETANGCFRTAKINLFVGASQIPASFVTLQYYECDNKITDNNNTNGIATFDFSDAKNTIENLFSGGVTATFYNNEADALAESNPIDIKSHRNEGYPTTQKIYVRIDSDDVNACLGLGHHVTLNVAALPDKNTIQDYVLCSDTNEATFDLTTKASEIIGTQTRPIFVSYHESEQDALNNNNPIAKAASYSSTTKTIYVRTQFDDNSNGMLDARECVSTDMSFNLVVNPNPVLINPDPIRVCSQQIDTEYDLTIRADQITNGDKTITLNYYKTQQDIINNTPITTPKAYTNTQLDRDIIVLATGANGCTKQITLSLKTILYANLNKNPIPIEECEIDNDGYDNFDVRRREGAILNGLTASNFTFTYYEEEADAIAGNTKAIQTPEDFANTQDHQYTQTIYARVQPVSNECFIVVPVTLIVNQVPEINIEEEYVICLDAASQSISPVLSTILPNPPIDTQLNITEYTFQWYIDSDTTDNLPGEIIAGATDAIYTPTAAGDYNVIATNRATGCTIPATTKVIGSYPPKSITVELGSDAFSGNNIFQVTVVGNGEYQYKLDTTDWQSDNRFENVRGGERVVYVRDLYHCNEVSAMQIVIDYPKYFTPNGDGTNDTWNIRGIATQPNAKVNVYDRYGKFLKQLMSTSSGWDGTYKGKLMPTDGYWFTLEYTEPRDNTIKIFKAHFTLKR